MNKLANIFGIVAVACIIGGIATLFLIPENITLAVGFFGFGVSAGVGFIILKN